MNSCRQCGKQTKNPSFCSKKCCSHWNNTNSMTEETQRKRGQKNSAGKKVPKNIFDVSSRTSSKILKRMGIGCFCCGWKEGSCDLHHIIPRKNGGSNDNNNLTYICPNCHRLAHEGKIVEFKNLQEIVGETWREYYYAHE